MSLVLSIHPLLCDRVRLAIMVQLLHTERSEDFSGLLASLGLTKGNLSSHLRKLEDAGLISVKKEFVERKPRSSYLLTKRGNAALKEYIETIEKVLKR
jgi:DNA-binding HxlR family transcriptional regulator